MKNTKYKKTTTETLEKTIIHLKQNHSNVFCAKCQAEILEQPVTEVIFAEPLTDAENAYIFETKKGLCFFVEARGENLEEIFQKHIGEKL